MKTASAIKDEDIEASVDDTGAVTDASANISETESKEVKKKHKKKKKKKRKDKKKTEDLETQLTSHTSNYIRKGNKNSQTSEVNPRLWIRLANEKKEIYYYNISTEAYSWLAPCSICGEMSQKWCNECAKSFCDAHYAVASSHTDSSSGEKGANEENKNKTGADLRGSSMGIGGSFFQAASSVTKVFSSTSSAADHSHTWQETEPYVKEELPPPPSSTPAAVDRSPRGAKDDSQLQSRRSNANALRPAYCLECQLRVATKICTECWDPYCAPCCKTSIATHSVCMYVCMYVCMCDCMSINQYVCMYVSMYVCVYCFIGSIFI